MIQRIQTVYFALTAVAMILMVFFPIALFADAQREVWFYLHHVIVIKDGVTQSAPIFVLIPIAIVITVITIASIFMFKQRKMQMRLAIYTMIMLVFLSVFFLYNVTMLASQNHLEYRYKISALLPFIALILTFLAWWNIRKDEKTVQSIDRIR